MENEKRDESIFEQENYDGGFGSGPLALAADEDTRADDASDDDPADLDDTDDTVGHDDIDA